MSCGFWLIVLIQLILLLSLNGIALKIWCNSNDIDLYYSENGIKWTNTHHGQTLQSKIEIGKRRLVDTIHVGVAPKAKLRFIGKSKLDCKVIYGNMDVNDNPDELWIKRKGIIIDVPHEGGHSSYELIDVFDFIYMYDDNYYHDGPITFRNGKDELKSQDTPVKYDASTNYVDEYMSRPENIYPLGGIQYVSKDNSKEYEIIRIRMTVQLDKFEGNEKDEVNIFGISGKHKEINSKECWPCISIQYFDESKKEFHINIHFGGIKFNNRIELSKEKVITINICTKINIIFVEFDYDVQDSELYKEAEQFLNKKLIIWIGEKIKHWTYSSTLEDLAENIIYNGGLLESLDPVFEGFITDLKIDSITQKQLPYQMHKMHRKKDMSMQTDLVKTDDVKTQTINGISDTYQATQTIPSEFMELNEMGIQANTDPNAKDTETSNTENENEHNMNPTQNNDSNKNSNTKLYIIIICSTVGNVLLLFSICIIMTFRCNKSTEKILSKSNTKAQITKKVDSSLKNNIIPGIAVIENPGSKIPSPPPPIYMKDYIDSPRIKQYYKTPKYKKDTPRYLDRESSPPMNMNNHGTTQQNGEHVTYS